MLQTTRRFYATVQNKMHYDRSWTYGGGDDRGKSGSHKRAHGLTTWADAPDGKIKKSDVTVAKKLSESG